MKKIKLLTSYRTWDEGEIVEMGDAKCEELIKLGRAKFWAESKEMIPKRRKRAYKTK